MIRALGSAPGRRDCGGSRCGTGLGGFEKEADGRVRRWTVRPDGHAAAGRGEGRAA